MTTKQFEHQRHNLLFWIWHVRIAWCVCVCVRAILVRCFLIVQLSYGWRRVKMLQILIERNREQKKTVTCCWANVPCRSHCVWLVVICGCLKTLVFDVIVNHSFSFILIWISCDICDVLDWSWILKGPLFIPEFIEMNILLQIKVHENMLPRKCLHDSWNVSYFVQNASTK